jgi:hypothetical protein
MSYFHNKTAAHLWFELAFYEQTSARIHIVFTILALKPRSTFFNNVTLLVFQLLPCLFYIHPNNISRQHSIAFWREKLRDPFFVVDLPFDYMAFAFITKVELAFNA